MAAIALVIKGAVVSPARFLRWRVEPHIVQYRRKPRKNNFERLNGTIQVLVVDGVLIMIDSIARARDFVANEENAVVARIGFELINRRICPRFNGWLHPHRRAKRRK